MSPVIHVVTVLSEGIVLRYVACKGRISVDSLPSKKYPNQSHLEQWIMVRSRGLNQRKIVYLYVGGTVSLLCVTLVQYCVLLAIHLDLVFYRSIELYVEDLCNEPDDMCPQLFFLGSKGIL